MRYLPILVLVLCASCVADQAELDLKACDADGHCAPGFACVRDRCLKEGTACAPGETQECGSSTGACRAGTQTCGADGAWGECTGAVGPTEELCDGIDNDCDGRVDEEVFVLCPLQKGVCAGAKVACVNGGAGSCGAAEYGPTFEAAETRCDGLDNDCDGQSDEGLDADGDGYGANGVAGCPKAGVDCDDSNGAVHPGAVEACNGADDNCDGRIDEGMDDDHDGYGVGAIACMLGANDCDDANPNVHPGAAEACNGADDNCDGKKDEGLDADQDGYGATASAGCRNPGLDCNDLDATVHPGATESCNAVDDNCDGRIDEGLDDDHDGYGASASAMCPKPGLDCDDTKAAVNPGATESCNAVDDNCDGRIDEGLDDDHDGYGLGAAVCTLGTGDCDDTNPAVHPNATEKCNGVDDNCDGKKDEGLDDDNDGYGKTLAAACPKAGVDCNDADATVNPGATESCNGVDDNCDGKKDGGLDDDGDGYGKTAAAMCPKTGVDCNDADPKVNPGATEACNAVDDNCDGRKDEGLDDDGDGYGNATAMGCPKAGVDCDDANAAVHPGATEICNAVDDNCDGTKDETFACVKGATLGSCTYTGSACSVPSTGVCSATCTVQCAAPVETCNGKDDNCDGKKDEGLDDDGDGYGKTLAAMCPKVGVDCNDANAAVNPGAAELCNGVDDNCDGKKDEGLDDDGDGYGKTVAAACPKAGVDCNDADATVNPGASEACNGIDDNCDGKKDETFACVQSTAVPSCSYTGSACTAASTGTCTNTCTLVCSAPTEICNGLDDNCDGQVDEGLSGAAANVSSTSVGSTAPSLFGVSSGGFVAAWAEADVAGSRVALRRFSAGAAAGTTSFATASGVDATFPTLGAGLVGWLQQTTKGKVLNVAPLTITSGGVTAGTAVAITNPNGANAIIPANATPSLGLQGSTPAVAWSTGSSVYVQLLTSAGLVSGSAMTAGSGTLPVLGMSEEVTPARGLVASLSGGFVQLWTQNAAGTGYALTRTLGSASLVAADSGAVAWAQGTAVTLFRVNSSLSQTTLPTPATGTVTGLSLKRIGTTDSWLLAYSEPRTAGGSELVVLRAAWTASGGWTVSTPKVADTTASTVNGLVGFDGVTAAVAYEKNAPADVFVQPFCP